MRRPPPRRPERPRDHRPGLRRPRRQALARHAPRPRPAGPRRYYTCPKGREPAAPEALAALAPGVSVPDPREALARALSESAPGDTVIVTGSIYLVGELRAALLGIEADPVIAL
jgi:hypothetical protein